MEMQAGEPFFADDVNPTGEELRVWAYAHAYVPFEDFHMVLDGPEVLPIVVACAQDSDCPSRGFLLESLYCTVGHLIPHDRARVRTVAVAARDSTDAAVRTWARRALRVIDGVEPMDRDQWCGWSSLATTDPIEPGRTAEPDG
jgi:hypothetical protein